MSLYLAMNVNELNDQPTVCAYLDCSLRATISCLPLQLCQGNGSHPASPDPGTGPGLLPLLLAPAVGDTRALGAAGLLLVLLQAMSVTRDLWDTTVGMAVLGDTWSTISAHKTFRCSSPWKNPVRMMCL